MLMRTIRVHGNEDLWEVTSQLVMIDQYVWLVCSILKATYVPLPTIFV